MARSEPGINTTAKSIGDRALRSALSPLNGSCSCRLTCSSPEEGPRWPGQHSGCHALVSTQSKAMRWCAYPAPDPHKCAQVPGVLTRMCSEARMDTDSHIQQNQLINAR